VGTKAACADAQEEGTEAADPLASQHHGRETEKFTEVEMNGLCGAAQEWGMIASLLLSHCSRAQIEGGCIEQ